MYVYTYNGRAWRDAGRSALRHRNLMAVCDPFALPARNPYTYARTSVGQFACAAIPERERERERENAALREARKHANFSTLPMLCTRAAYTSSVLHADKQ